MQGGAPCPQGGLRGSGTPTRKLWSVLLPTPSPVWAPRLGTRSFPLCWGQGKGATPSCLGAGRAEGELGRCSSDFWLLPHPEPAAVLAVQPARLRYFALTLHLCLFSTHFIHMTQPHGWQGGRWAGSRLALRPNTEARALLFHSDSIWFTGKTCARAEGTHSTAASFLIPCSTGSPGPGSQLLLKRLGTGRGSLLSLHGRHNLPLLTSSP